MSCVRTVSKGDLSLKKVDHTYLVRSVSRNVQFTALGPLKGSLPTVSEGDLSLKKVDHTHLARPFPRDVQAVAHEVLQEPLATVPDDGLSLTKVDHVHSVHPGVQVSRAPEPFQGSGRLSVCSLLVDAGSISSTNIEEKNKKQNKKTQNKKQNKKTQNKNQNKKTQNQKNKKSLSRTWKPSASIVLTEVGDRIPIPPPHAPRPTRSIVGSPTSDLYKGSPSLRQKKYQRKAPSVLPRIQKMIFSRKMLSAFLVVASLTSTVSAMKARVVGAYGKSRSSHKKLSSNPKIRARQIRALRAGRAGSKIDFDAEQEKVQGIFPKKKYSMNIAEISKFCTWLRCEMTTRKRFTSDPIFAEIVRKTLEKFQYTEEGEKMMRSCLPKNKYLGPYGFGNKFVNKFFPTLKKDIEGITKDFEKGEMISQHENTARYVTGFQDHVLHSVIMDDQQRAQNFYTRLRLRTAELFEQDFRDKVIDFERKEEADLQRQVEELERKGGVDCRSKIEALERKRRPRIVTEPYHRTWQVMKEQDDDAMEGGECNDLTVVTYNLLAQGLSETKNGGFATFYRQGTPHQYTIQGDDHDTWVESKAYQEVMFGKTNENKYGPIENNHISPRLLRCLSFILERNPDIICVQELDRFDDFVKILGPLGYQGVFQQKPHNLTECGKRVESAAAKFNGGKGADGVAIFWNVARLKYEEHEGRRLHKFGKPFNSTTVGDYSGNVILSAGLTDMKKEKSIRVVTGHLKAGKKLADIKNKKWMACEVADVLHRYHAAKDKVPIIFAADFNASVKTEAYKIFYEGVDAEGIEDREEFRNVAFAISRFMAPCYNLSEDDRNKLFSAIKLRIGGAQAGKIGIRDLHTIDFIFCSTGENGFEVQQVLQLPNSTEILTSDEELREAHTKDFVHVDTRENHFRIYKCQKDGEQEFYTVQFVKKILDGYRIRWTDSNQEEDVTEESQRVKITLDKGAIPYIPEGAEASRIGLPNPKSPSDHFMKVARIRWVEAA